MINFCLGSTNLYQTWWRWCCLKWCARTLNVLNVSYGLNVAYIKKIVRNTLSATLASGVHLRGIINSKGTALEWVSSERNCSSCHFKWCYVGLLLCSFGWQKQIISRPWTESLIGLIKVLMKNDFHLPYSEVLVIACGLVFMIRMSVSWSWCLCFMILTSLFHDLDVFEKQSPFPLEIIVTACGLVFMEVNPKTDHAFDSSQTEAGRDQRQPASNQWLLVSIRSLFASNQSLWVSIWSFLASNWSLVVSVWTLLASNWSLLVSIWSLLASNQLLLVSIWSLLGSNQSLLVSIWSLLASNQSLLVSGHYWHWTSHCWYLSGH